MNKKDIKKGLMPYIFLLVFFIGCLLIFNIFNNVWFLEKLSMQVIIIWFTWFSSNFNVYIFALYVVPFISILFFALL